MTTRNETTDRIEKSFLSILKTVSFGKVTVTLIIKTADVSHQTFYRYYTDKYDLALKIAYDKLSAFSLIYGNDATWKEIVISMLYSIKNHPVFFKRLLKNTEGAELVHKSILMISENFTGKSASTHSIAAWISIFKEWCKNDFQTPVDEIYRKIIDHVPNSEIIPDEEIGKYRQEYESCRLTVFSGKNI